jgi:FixJ family two-component response regulator
VRGTSGLTERWVEIVTLLARGLPTKEIAAELTLLPHTVRGDPSSSRFVGFAGVGADRTPNFVAIWSRWPT